MSDKTSCWPERRHIVPVVVLFVVGAVAARFLWTAGGCPEEYWPHKVNSVDRPAVPCDQVLREIVDLALKAHLADTTQTADIELSIQLALQCAYQDGIDPAKQVAHRRAVDLAYAYAKNGKWKDCATALTVDPVNHPH
ncbi:MAG TPA: hypothetical protein VFY93_15230 [Planctomycetota bacterium]|nr:hypothetical protein [Planctomycetota bacterium]